MLGNPWFVDGLPNSLWDDRVAIGEGAWSELYEYISLGESAKRTVFVVGILDET